MTIALPTTNCLPKPNEGKRFHEQSGGNRSGSKKLQQVDRPHDFEKFSQILIERQGPPIYFVKTARSR